jgi:hypothetical protein
MNDRIDGAEGREGTSEGARGIRRRADELTAEAMQRAHESGELRHLYGRPLQLDDDPEWLANKVLKRQGFSHPLIERSRELDAPREAVASLAEKLIRRRRWLSSPESQTTCEEVELFNRWRMQALEEYREKLMTLNNAIRDYNLQAPDALHQRPTIIDDAVARLAAEAPELDLGAPASHRASRRRWWQLRRK